MPRRYPLLASLAILVAATVGAGIFSLPFIFQRTGMFRAAFLLLILALVVAASHALYYEALQKEGTRESFLSLVKKYFGPVGSALGFFITVVGIFLALAALLAVGARFVGILFPFLGASGAVLVFWILGSLFLTENRREGVKVGLFATAGIAFVIVFLVGLSSLVRQSSLLAPEHLGFLVAFGPILFAISGWTGVEPIRDVLKGTAGEKKPGKLFLFGTLFVAAVYVLFAVAIVRISSPVAPDTLSGISYGMPWLTKLLAFFGALAIVAGYFPLGLEAKRSLKASLKFSTAVSDALVILLPVAIIFLTAANFLDLIGVTGGIFISVQYLLILAVSRKSLHLRGMKLCVWFLASGVFTLALLGEAYYIFFG